MGSESSPFFILIYVRNNKGEMQTRVNILLAINCPTLPENPFHQDV